MNKSSQGFNPEKLIFSFIIDLSILKNKCEINWPSILSRYEKDFENPIKKIYSKIICKKHISAIYYQDILSAQIQ